MGTQKSIAQQITDGGGDYILALKGNHSTLHDEVREFLESNKKQKYCNYTDCGHGRIENRKCFSTEEYRAFGDGSYSANMFLQLVLN